MPYTGTSDLLTANAVYTGRNAWAGDYDSVAGTVFADKAGTLLIQQSFDGTNYDWEDSVSVSVSTKTKFSVTLVATYWRLKYTNGGADQGVFRLNARTSASGDS